MTEADNSLPPPPRIFMLRMLSEFQVSQAVYVVAKLGV